MRIFILLVDSLYYKHKNVIIEAYVDVSLDKLFSIQGTTHEKQIFHDEQFSFSKSLSRLKQMQTKPFESILGKVTSLLKDKKAVSEQDF